MKDGRTHLAHKAEHAVDLETGAIVGVTVQGADEGDTTTIQETLPEAAEQLEAVAAVTHEAVAVIEEVVADKGYHSRTTVHDLETLEIRTYISEPDRGPQSWTNQEAERDAVYANRRRIRGDRGQRLLRKRGELLERPCAHLYETGDSGACTCAATKTCSSGCSCMRAPSIWGSGCGRFSGSLRPAVSRALAALGGVLSTLWSLVCKTITPIGSQTDRPTPSVPTDEPVNCVSLKTPLAPRAARRAWLVSLVEYSDSGGRSSLDHSATSRQPCDPIVLDRPHARGPAHLHS